MGFDESEKEKENDGEGDHIPFPSQSEYLSNEMMRSIIDECSSEMAKQLRINGNLREQIQQQKLEIDDLTVFFNKKCDEASR